MARIEFKPCPLCGKTPVYQHFNDGIFWYERIRCNHCNMMLTAIGTPQSKGDNVARFWNRRYGERRMDVIGDDIGI